MRWLKVPAVTPRNSATRRLGTPSSSYMARAQRTFSGSVSMNLAPMTTRMSGRHAGPVGVAARLVWAAGASPAPPSPSRSQFFSLRKTYQTSVPLSRTFF